MSAGDPVAQLDQYAAAEYEAGDAGLGPWSRDPDGGQIRLILALRRLLTEVDDPRLREIVSQVFDSPEINSEGPPPGMAERAFRAAERAHEALLGDDTPAAVLAIEQAMEEWGELSQVLRGRGRRPS